jgi:hypothetical protein
VSTGSEAEISRRMKNGGGVRKVRVDGQIPF